MDEIVEPIKLLPSGVLDTMLEEARERLQAISGETTRYDSLVAAALIYQDLGNRLSAVAYQHVNATSAMKLACAAGCATCCHMPSDVGGGASFQLSFLDYITLLESQELINRAIEEVVPKAARNVENARTGQTVPCPYLSSDGACGIYEIRPVPCKIWFSRDLAPCLRNRESGYRSSETNTDTAASKDLLNAFDKPFIDFLAERSDFAFYDGYDFLRFFAYAARLHETGLVGMQKDKISEGDLNWWPFLEYASPAWHRSQASG